MEWFKLFSGEVVLMMVDLFSLQVMQVQGGMGKVWIEPWITPWLWPPRLKTLK